MTSKVERIVDMQRDSQQIVNEEIKHRNIEHSVVKETKDSMLYH